MRVLYGREKPIRTLIDPSIPVVVVTGDSGVGKSTVLSACRDSVQESHLASVNITRLPHRTGGLQVSIFNQLMLIATQLIREQKSATQFAQKVANRARAVIGPRRKDFALAVAKELLNVVKERVGSDTGQAMGEFFADISADNSESMLERLHTQVDADALQALVDIADEVASASEASPLYLFFENAQNLSDEDLRQLADLPSMLPERVVLRLEHMDSKDDHRRRIRLMVSAGIVEAPLRGLGEEVVQFWCQTQNIPEALHKRIHRSTNGYPLFVDDAISQVKANRRLGNISPNENFRASTIDGLNDLDPEAASAARRLSAFIDPPQREHITDILGEGMTLARWEGVEARLERARIFTTSADGIPWFHELRRRCIWESLSSAFRREVADRAVSFIADSFEETRNPELLINLALVASDSSEVRNDPRARHIVDATLDEVALLSALLEIAEVDNRSPNPEIPTALGDSVFDYCRLVFMAEVDALSALENLNSAEIVFVSADDNASVLIPRLSRLAFILALGRAGVELPRFPIPAIASTIFGTAFSPRLLDFVTCSYGIGYPRLRKVVEDGVKAHKIQAQQQSSGRSVHSVFLRGSIEQQPFYAYSTFSDAETAARSFADLRGAAGRHWGVSVDIDQLFQLPTVRIRDRRFTNALERIKFTPHPESSFMKEVSKKAALLRYVRASCSGIERAVLDLEETTSYFVLEKGRDAVVVEVTGGGDGVKKLDGLVPDDYRFAGPYRWADLRKMLNLGIGEKVGRITFSTAGATRYEPKNILDALSSKARQFNKSQPFLNVSTSSSALQAALSASLRDTYHDAQALCAVLSQYGDVSLMPRKTLLVIYIHGEEGKYFSWGNSRAVYLRFPTPGAAHDTIKVKVIECESIDSRAEDFNSHFAEDLREAPHSLDVDRITGSAVTSFWLRRELGYEDSVTFLPLEGVSEE
ncbi:ATP-binding protein [Streptomyces sp. LaPpAH-108]|uniref:ATP-binding protein n=1 Tax=Streptomyces sp. LaPpAH-108 TaxID=1155714 RepID=UPI0003A09440|nr:ATP-binding protein [Streptomyces sp. LaPpAH-108]